MTYPISMPDSLVAQGLVITYKVVVGVNESEFTFEDDTHKWPGERWQISFTPPPTSDRELAEEWFTFAGRLRGRHGTFLCGDPKGRNPKGNAGGTPLVDGANQEGYVLAIKGASPNVTDWLLPGDYLQIRTGSLARLHMVELPVDTDSAGDALIPLFPTLGPSIPDNSQITLVNARGVFRLDDNDISLGRKPGMDRFSFTASSLP